jgi:hypothetical protein
VIKIKKQEVQEERDPPTPQHTHTHTKNGEKEIQPEGKSNRRGRLKDKRRVKSRPKRQTHTPRKL